MDRYRVVIFGLGKKYEREKRNHADRFAEMEVAAYLDNKKELWGKLVDGVPVLPPARIVTLEYDKVILMADYVNEMREQLVALGVCRGDILLWEQFLCIREHGVFHDYAVARIYKAAREKVLLLSVKLDYNGGTIAVVNAAKALMVRGYDVTVAADGANAKLLEEMQREGIPIVIAPAINDPAKEELGWIGQFDIVLVNTFHLIRCASVISAFRPVIWWIHESSARHTKVYPHVRDNQHEFAGEAAFRAANILSVSRKAAENFNHYYPQRIKESLTYGIPDICMERGSGERGICVFAVIGVVVPIKAQLVFLEAAGMLEERLRENAEFWIIGNCGLSPYAARVCERAAQMPRVKIMGEITREEMRERYGQIDVVVCCSLEETMSLTVTEGMMNGRVCITTDETGMADYIEDGENGFVCRAGSAQSLYEKMKWILEHPDRCEAIRKKARKTYEEHFTMERFGRRLEAAMESTMKGRYLE